MPVSDAIARTLSLDPLAVRRLNMIESKDLPYVTATGETYRDITPAECQAAAANMPVMYISAFVCSLVIALIMAHIMVHMASIMPVGAVHGAFFGFMAWLGFAAPTSYATAIFSGKPKQLWLIDTSYNLVSFLLAGIILAVWR